MTKRAEKLGKYLEEKLGWTVYDTTYECKDCGYELFAVVRNYCPECGGSNIKRNSSKKEVNEQLEEAIKYALGE